MSEFSNNPQNQQEKYLNMMPQYGQVPENEFRVGFGRRLGAALLDVIFVTILLVFGMMVFGLFDYMASIDWESAMMNPEEMSIITEAFLMKLLPLSLSITFAYYSMEIFFAATPGKMALNIKIGNSDRTIADFSNLAKRFIIKNISSVFTLLYLITALSFFNTIGTVLSLVIFGGFFLTLAEHRQALHDKIANTAVFFKDEFKIQASNYENE